MHWKSYLSHQIYHLRGKYAPPLLTFSMEVLNVRGSILVYKNMCMHVSTRFKHTPFPLFLLCLSPTGRKPSTWANPSRCTQMDPQLLPTYPLVWISGLINILTIFFFQKPSIISFFLDFLYSVPNVSEIQNWYLKLLPVKLKKKSAIKCETKQNYNKTGIIEQESVALCKRHFARVLDTWQWQKLPLGNRIVSSTIAGWRVLGHFGQRVKAH